LGDHGADARGQAGAVPESLDVFFVKLATRKHAIDHPTDLDALKQIFPERDPQSVSLGGALLKAKHLGHDVDSAVPIDDSAKQHLTEAAVVRLHRRSARAQETRHRNARNKVPTLM
jgi:hypothetical protein